MYFNQAPFLRLTFCFALGILVYHYWGEFIPINLLVPLSIFVLYIALARLNSRKYHILLSFLAMTLVFVFGFLRLQALRLDNKPDHLLRHGENIEAYEAVIVEEPAIKRKSVNLRVEAMRVFKGGKWLEASGLVNAYAAKEMAGSLHYGDRLLIKGSPVPTATPANPGEFDFANYLVYRNIFHQQFIGDDFVVTGRGSPNWFVAQSIKWRNLCRRRLMSHIPDGEVRSVMLAIVLGIKDELDPELQSAFSASGAMHVLAVSGLHVGIIYALVLLVFKWLRVDDRKGRWLIAALSILSLWCYAFLTGLSPSVLRAVTMFSFVALAKAMNRHSNIYNTLAASAFILLWYNPYLIMSVGFQLSYLAVFGIVYLQPRFYRLFTVRNYWLDKVWGLTCVSLAAQIATAPLSILYFHQFPSYFLVSNLFIIPAAFAMLILGLAMLILSPIPLVGEGLGWLIESFVGLVNSLVFWVRDLPGSTFSGINITTGQSWLIYAIIIFLILLFSQKKIGYLYAAFFTACLFGVLGASYQRQYLESGVLRVLNVPNASVLDFRFGNQARLMADSAFLHDENRRRFHFEPGRLEAGTPLDPEKDNLVVAVSAFMGNELVCFQGETFLILKKAFPKEAFHNSIKVNYLVVSRNSIKNLNQIKGIIDFKTLLIDASNKGYVAKRLASQAKDLGLKAHAIREDGYFEKRWKK